MRRQRLPVRARFLLSERTCLRLGLVVLAFSFLAMPGCGSGPGGPGPAALPFTGVWFLFRTDGDGVCGDSPELGLRLEFTQVGDEVTGVTTAGTLVGTATGSSATMAGTLVVVDSSVPRYVTYTTILLERTGDTITGTALVAESLSSTGFPPTCTGTANLKAVPEFELLSVNLDGAAGVALNTPIILTFNQDVDASTVTPDTLRVTGGPFGAIFEFAAIDGPRIALVPQSPNFIDLSDSGFAPGDVYTVDLADYFDPASIESFIGAPLAPSATVMFSTALLGGYVEPRRALIHAPGPMGVPPGTGDEEGCVDNAGTSLFASPGLQTGAGPADTLLCLVNEGAPHIIPERCIPTHDARNVGMSSPGPSTGTYFIPAIQIELNEPQNPALSIAYNASSQLGANAQLWRVGDAAGNPIAVSESNQVETNVPLLLQNSLRTRLILVASDALPSGTYLVNVRGLTDLAGNALVTTDAPSPSIGGYTAIETAIAGVVPPGWRLYFRTP